MNPVTVLVGIAAIAYGVFTAWARYKKPEKFKKLEPMKKFWGEKAGPIIHVVGYTVVPIVVGFTSSANDRSLPSDRMGLALL